MSQLVKTVQGLAIASVKTVQGLAIASVKTIQGLDNTAAGGGPAYSGIEGHGGGSPEATTVATGSITTTTGRILIAFICWDDSLTRTVTGVTGGGTGITWTSKISKTIDTRHGQAVQVYIGTGFTGGSGAVTATFSGGAAYRSISVVEVSGANATQFDATATDIADAGAAVDCAITTTQANCLVVGFTFDDSGSNTISLPANMSSINNFNDSTVYGATHYRTTNPGSGATTVDWTFSGTDDAVSCAVAVAP